MSAGVLVSPVFSALRAPSYVNMVAMSYQLEDADVPYEDDVAANPYSTKSWWRYLQYKSDAPHSHRNILAERALTHLPGSYKIWHYYLQFRVGSLSEQCVVSEEYEEVNQLFERAFEYMNKMPRIWLVACLNCN